MRADSLGQLMLLNEVEQCILYAVSAGNIDKDKVDYWRLNRAVDKRYTFKITSSVFAHTGILIVKYRGQHCMVKDGKATLTGC